MKIYIFPDIIYPPTHPRIKTESNGEDYYVEVDTAEELARFMQESGYIIFQLRYGNFSLRDHYEL